MAEMKNRQVSVFRLASLLRIEKDPLLALQLFQNPNPNQVPAAKPFSRNCLVYDLIISKLGRAKMFREMEVVLYELKQEIRIIPKEIIFCNVLKFYGRARLPDRALGLFHQIPSLRCERTVKSVNSLLNALLKCGEFEKLREVYASINNYAVPDTCTYNILIKASFASESVPDAWVILDEMHMRMVSPNDVTFGMLISGLCSNSMLDEAIKLKEDMIHVYEIMPNASTYACLIKGFFRINDLSSALKLKDEMFVSGVVFDSAVYTTLIHGFFSAGRKQDAFKLLDEMPRNGCKPDTATYNAVISGLCMEKDFYSAFNVMNGMVKEGCKPDIVTYNTFISWYCKNGNMKKANELFEDMPRRGCFPDVVTYRMLFDGFVHGMELEEAAFILGEMAFKGYAPHQVSMNKFVEHLYQAECFALLWEVISCLMKEDIISKGTWEILVKFLCKDRLPTEWFDTFSIS